MLRLTGLVCCILASLDGAWGARCPPLPPVPPDLPPSFCDPGGGWEALPSLPADESVPGMLLEPVIMEGVQQALANATGWAPRLLPQLSATVDGCRRTVCGWFFWLRLNITCPHSGGQSAAELMLALPGRSSRNTDRTPVVSGGGTAHVARAGLRTCPDCVISWPRQHGLLLAEGCDS